MTQSNDISQIEEQKSKMSASEKSHEGISKMNLILEDSFDETRKKSYQYNNDDSEEAVSGLTCWQKFRFFVKQSFKDIWRHKC